MNILMTGATGLVGSRLGQALVRCGHRLFVISRNRSRAQLSLNFPAHIIEGDLSQEPVRDELLKKIDAAIHLAGESIAGKRWTAKQKAAIYNSRVRSLQNLLITLYDSPRVKALVGASAIGFYGDAKDQLLDEDSARGQDFLSQVCQDWEQPLLQIHRDKNVPLHMQQLRSVILRLGVVLSAEGGALAKMLPLFRSGLAGCIGDGQQWMSWIDLEDLVQLFVHAVESESMSGIYNAVAPQPVRNREFSQTLSDTLKGAPSRLGPPVPRAVLQLALGEMAQIITFSQRVQSARLATQAFSFKYPDLQSSLAHQLQLLQGPDSLFLAEQYLPLPVDVVFPFFAEAGNLEKITPPSLHFNIQSVSTPQVQEGTRLEYKLRIHGMPVKWVSEIQNWQPNEQFVDMQLRGPYRKWHHTHRFSALGPGTLMSDVVRYQLPLGGVGRLVAGALVRQDIENIFAYRRSAVLPLLMARPHEK